MPDIQLAATYILFYLFSYVEQVSRSVEDKPAWVIQELGLQFVISTSAPPKCACDRRLHNDVWEWIKLGMPAA